MTESVMQAAAISDIVLPSFEDEAIFFGDLNEEITVQRYVTAKVGCCVVKNGAGRILAYEDGYCVNCDPIQNVILVDSTAAGDSFNAGFIGARLQGADLNDAVCEGSLLAAQVILKSGALVEVDFTLARHRN
jgi:2-dehydro-3-deoxygluconokinase